MYTYTLSPCTMLTTVRKRGADSYVADSLVEAKVSLRSSDLLYFYIIFFKPYSVVGERFGVSWVE